MLHVFAGPDLAAGDRGDSGWFQTGSFGGPMKPGLPNIGWAMAFGEGYADEVDAEAIRDAGFAVEWLDGAWLVRVTDRLADVAEDFGHFSGRRATLKGLFRPDLFWVTDEPA
jgi:hypothetical protein